MPDSNPSPSIDTKPDDIDNQTQQQQHLHLHPSSSEKDSTDPSALEKGADPPGHHEASTTPRDPNIVTWDGPDDPQNPYNWTQSHKLSNISLVIVLCLITPLASSMFAPGVPQVLIDLDAVNAPTIAEFVVSIYILGFAVGPLLISPLSEIYGRWPVYVVCNVLFFVFTIACAVAGSITQLIVFRFFAGLFGVCPVTLGGASIADIIPQEKRGTSMSLFSVGPLLGPVIGPVAGGYLAASVGWRWTFWVIAIATAICTIVHFFFCHETFSPVLLARKTARLQKETGNMDLRSAQDDGLPNKERVIRAMVRPFKMLLFSPIVSLMAIYAAFVYGVLYMLYTTYTFVFTEYYNFTPSNVGLVFIGSGIGMFIGLAINMTLSDRVLKSKAAKHGTGMKPEYRLISLLYTGWLVPVGIFIYGWTIEYRVHWIVPLFGTLVFGIGILTCLVCISQYLIDAYTLYAASATAAATVLRSILGGLLPLAGLSLYDALGQGWGNSLCGFIAVLLTPVPFLFYFFGERIRKSATVKL